MLPDVHWPRTLSRIAVRRAPCLPQAWAATIAAAGGARLANANSSAAERRRGVAGTGASPADHPTRAGRTDPRKLQGRAQLSPSRRHGAWPRGVRDSRSGNHFRAAGPMRRNSIMGQRVGAMGRRSSQPRGAGSYHELGPVALLADAPPARDTWRSGLGDRLASGTAGARWPSRRRHLLGDCSASNRNGSDWTRASTNTGARTAGGETLWVNRRARCR